MPEAQTGRRHVDLLAKVAFIDGAQGAVFLHMEVQDAIRELCERGYTYDKIITLYKVVDFIMALPKEYEELVQQVIREAEQQSEWLLTSLEKFAIERDVLQGIEQGIAQRLQQGPQQRPLLLESRFGAMQPELRARITQIEDETLLRELYPSAATAECLQAFAQQFQKLNCLSQWQ